MLHLRNKFIFAPVKTGYGDKAGHITGKHLNFYERRAKFAGAITPEPLYLSPGLRELPTQIGISNDKHLPGLYQLTEVIHQQGAKAIAHLNHPGRMANPKIPGNYFVSSTNNACKNGGAVPHALNRKEMDEVIRLFKDAARRAENANFDIIELQMGHGYLLAQFLSPDVNDRSDEYGGSWENRKRFPLEVFQAVKHSTQLPVIVRISADEMVPEGLHMNEMVALSKELEEAGASAVHVSAGSACSTPPWFFQHMFVPKGKTWDWAAQIQSHLTIPVIFVGRINSPKDVEKLEKEYNAAYMALGRALIADPDFIGKYQGKLRGTIRPCLACAEGCLGGVKGGKGLHCVVNPYVGESDSPVEKAQEKKKVAVVGGGLAGMQAALTLKERGHEPVIYEKEKLGGQFNLAWLPPKKESLKEIIDYFSFEIEDQDIEVRKEVANVEKLTNGEFQKVLLATGAKPAIPPVEGLKDYFWTEFLFDEILPENKHCLIIGGGLIGVEMASKLVDKNNKVAVVEMMDELAGGMEMIEKTMTLQKLEQHQVEKYIGYKVEKIEAHNAHIRKNGESKTLNNIDHIIVAAGMKSYHPLAKELEGKIPAEIIGDARKTGKAQQAIRDAFITAKSF